MEVPPQSRRRGLVGETWFPPRERAEGERRSFQGREELAAAQHPFELVAPVRLVVQLLTSIVLKPFGVVARPRQARDLSEEEFRTLVDAGSAQGQVDARERRLIHRVFEFNDKNVGQVMTPRERIFAWWKPMCASRCCARTGTWRRRAKPCACWCSPWPARTRGSVTSRHAWTRVYCHRTTCCRPRRSGRVSRCLISDGRSERSAGCFRASSACSA